MIAPEENKNSSDLVPAVVLGGGVNGLLTTRSLGRYSIPVHLLGVRDGDIASSSRYADVQELPPDADPSLVVSQIQALSNRLNLKPVVLFTSDIFLNIVSEHRDQLSDYCQLNLPERIAVSTVLNKGLFGQFCADEELPAPRGWSPDSIKESGGCIVDGSFPLVIKPIFSSDSANNTFSRNGQFAKMILVNSADELTYYCQELRKRGARIRIEEYITGPDDEHYSFVSYRDRNDNELAAAGFRKLRIFPVHAGAGTFAEPVDDHELNRKGREVVDKLRYRGVSSVCFKRELRTGRLMIHEVNGRLPNLHGTAQLVGVNFPLVAYQDTIGKPMNPIGPRAGNTRWISLSSDIQAFRGYRAHGEMSLLDWLKSLLSVRHCAEFALDDLRPFGVTIRAFSTRLFHKIGTKVIPKRTSKRYPASISHHRKL